VFECSRYHAHHTIFRVDIEDTLAIERIRAAFPAKAIDARDAFQSWGQTYLDARSYRDAIHGKSWDQLDSAYLAVRSDALGFLSTHTLVDVLPAYLRIMLELGTASEVPGMLTLIVRAPDGEHPALGAARFSAFVEALLAQQRGVVAATLARFTQRFPGTLVGEAARCALLTRWGALGDQHS